MNGICPGSFDAFAAFAPAVRSHYTLHIDRSRIHFVDRTYPCYTTQYRSKRFHVLKWVALSIFCALLMATTREVKAADVDLAAGISFLRNTSKTSNFLEQLEAPKYFVVA